MNLEASACSLQNCVCCGHKILLLISVSSWNELKGKPLLNTDMNSLQSMKLYHEYDLECYFGSLLIWFIFLGIHLHGSVGLSLEDPQFPDT